MYSGGIPKNFLAPYPYNLILTTSVGFAIVIAIEPEAIPAAIFYNNVGFTPSGKGPQIASRIGTYIPIRRPAKTHYLWNPAVRPLYKESAPSSAAMVFIVPISPLYFGVYPSGTTCTYNLTLAVSSGIVTNSAVQAANAAAATFLAK